MGTLVSVMVPAYNASATIISTLDSVAAQTYRPIELIIINDGSTDDTGDLIKAWIARNEDPLLHVIYHVQRNMGLAASRKIGVDLSTGSILQFLDADDLLHPMKVRIAENVLTEGNVPVVVTQTKHFWDEAQIEVDLTAPPNQANWPRLFLPSACTHLWTTAGPAFKREIVLELGTAELDASSVDEEIIFHSRFKLNGCRVAYIPLVLNFYRRGHDGSMNKTLGRVVEGRLLAQEKLARLIRRSKLGAVRCLWEWCMLVKYCVHTYASARCVSEQHKSTALASLKAISAAAPGMFSFVGTDFGLKFVELITMAWHSVRWIAR